MEFHAAQHWTCVDFISDLHLQAGDLATFAAWRDYMQSTPAGAVCILGDLFEVWVGDDAVLPGSFESECVSVLRAAGERLALYIMQGNRDFLMGPQLMQACHATALPDPSVFDCFGQRWLLTHGDAQCVDDREYQVFRQQVRSAQWIQDFLAKPLTERLAMARELRRASEARKKTLESYADVDTRLALELLDANACSTLLHGHTHQPASHPLAGNRTRLVLSDWDGHATPPRAEVLRVYPQAQGLRMERLPVLPTARSRV